MVYLGLLLIFLTGFLLLKRISTVFTITECVGWAFPLGLGVVTLCMMLMDWICIPLTSVTLLILTIILLAAAIASVIPIRRHLLSSLRPNFSFHWFNFVWLLLFILIVYAEYSNLLKTLYFPAYDRDSMAGFDTIGFVAAQEHTYHGMSIFDGSYMPRIHQAGSYITYMPMLQLSYAYVYALGAYTSKAIPAFFFLSFLFGFYGAVKRATCPTAALFATFGMLMSPEMFSFSSLSNTNVMHACLASGGIIYLCLWFRGHLHRDLLLGCLLLAINCFMRTEGFVFVFAAFLLVLWRSVQDKRYFRMLLPLGSLIPILLFYVYAQTYGLTAQNVLIAPPFWDSQKASDLVGGAFFLVVRSPFYGWTFWLTFLSFVLNIVPTFKHRDSLAPMLCLLLPLGLYILLLYHINFVWDTLEHIINFSAKRFLFCFVPIAWFYIVTNQTVRNSLTKGEKYLSFYKSTPTKP